MNDNNNNIFILPSINELKNNKVWSTTHTDVSKPAILGVFVKKNDRIINIDDKNGIKSFPKYKNAPIPSDLNVGFDNYQDKSSSSSITAATTNDIVEVLHRNQYDLQLNNVQFVSYRNNFNKILGTLYDRKKDWTILLRKRNKTIFMEIQSLDNDNNNNNEELRRYEYFGRYFETLSTENPSDSEHCVVVKLRIGRFRCVLGAEIDCINIMNELVELKTVRVIERQQQLNSFKRYKIGKYWIQSFLVGCEHIIVGHRDDLRGKLVQIEHLHTSKLLKLCSIEQFNGNACLKFATHVFEFIVKHVNNDDRTYTLTYASDENCIRIQ